MKTVRKGISLLLALLVVIGIIPFTALGVEAETSKDLQSPIENTSSAAIYSSTDNVDLTIGGTSEQTIILAWKGDFSGTYTFSCARNNSNVSWDWGDWNGSTLPITLKAQTEGSTVLTFSFLDRNTDEEKVLSTCTVNVNVGVQKYSVSYDANGGVGAPEKQEKQYGTDLEISTTNPTRSGYCFMGWALTSFADNADYQPGSIYSGNSEITLYAVWAPHPYAYTVTKNPTTGAAGTIIGKCSKCSASTTITLPKLNTTDYNYSVLKAATCTATGTGRYTWKTTTYGTRAFDVTVPETEHSYTTTVTAPTETVQGYTTYTCRKCSHSYKADYVSPKPTATPTGKPTPTPIPVKITTQPKTTYTKSGSTAKVTAKASGDGLKYTWYIKNSSASKFTKSSTTSAVYSVKMSSTTKDRKVYCVVTDKYGKTAKTNTVTLRMAASVTAQPKTTYAKNGSKASVTVKAAGDGLTYTWYVKNKGASKYTKSSVTKSVYAVTMNSKVKDRLVYCVVKDKYGNSVKTKTVALCMAATVASQPKTAYVKSGATAKVTVKAAGDGLKYTWYVKNKGASKYTKSSVTKSTYTATMSSKTKDRQVYCVVKDKYGNKVQTKTVALRMVASITTQPKTVTVAKNKTAKVTVKATGDGLKYTWYYKNKGASKYTKSGVTTATYSVKMTSKTNGRQVYCVVKDKYGKTVKSKTVTVKMK